jgi:mannose-1-phosphate guanylyltransferase
MRAMVLAAGLGTRMQPLTDLRAKPALPVRGRPVVSLLLELLAACGVREVLINLHHLPDSIRDAVARDHPDGLTLDWSVEDEPLGTGGGIRRAADFLQACEDCLVLAGDMLLDVDLEALRARHRAAGWDATLVLLDDPRTATFGSIGIDTNGRVVRIGERPVAAKDAGEEVAAGLFTSVRFFRAEALADWPGSTGPAFEDLRDWLIPRVESGSIALGALIVPPTECTWEPVGTPDEYLAANLRPPCLPRLGGSAQGWAGDLSPTAPPGNVVARSAHVAPDARLERSVVWDGESVPSGFRGRDGVYAGGTFHACRLPDPDARIGTASGSAQ